MLLRNSANFAEINTPKINQNALIGSVSSCKKTRQTFQNRQERKQTMKNNKFLQKFNVLY